MYFLQIFTILLANFGVDILSSDRFLGETGFRDSFDNKGRLRPLLESMPLSVIVADEPGLLGAAARAARL